MKKVVVIITTSLFLSSCGTDSCNSEEVQNRLLNIEKALGLDDSKERSIEGRLKSIDEALAKEEQVIYVLPKQGFDIEHGADYNATVMVRKFNPLDERNAAVVINDSVMPLEYDSLQDGHVINFQPTKLGENNCYGMVTFNKGRDTMKFRCDFTVRSSDL